MGYRSAAKTARGKRFAILNDMQEDMASMKQN